MKKPIRDLKGKLVAHRKAPGFPDEALEGWAPGENTLAKIPECPFCNGLFWAGDHLVVLSAKRVAHLSCAQDNAQA